MNDYEKDHVTFDHYEMPVTLHCLKCNTVIARRDEVPSQKNPNVALHAMVKAPNYREVEVELSDGSLMYMPLCADCTKNPIDPDKALDVVKAGWVLGLKQHGRPQEAINRLKRDKASLKVTNVRGIKDARKLQ